MVVLPVVRKVVTGSAPFDWRALQVVEAFVERKAGVETPELQLWEEGTAELQDVVQPGEGLVLHGRGEHMAEVRPDTGVQPVPGAA